MFEAGLPGAVPSADSDRADELFQQHRGQIFRQTDQLFSTLILFQWVACILVALVVSRDRWEGGGGPVDLPLYFAIFAGGGISLLAAGMVRMRPGQAITRHSIAVSQMLMSALLIGLTAGRMETHFHLFGSLVILAFYRDWRVLITATVVAALDHLVRGIYWPYSLYGVPDPSGWRSFEHIGWLSFENIFLILSCLRSVHEMRSIARRTASLETSDQNSRQLFDEAPIGMAVVAFEDEKFKQANTRFSQMLGYSEEELFHRTPLDVTHPDDVAETNRLVKAMIAGGEHSATEKRYIRKNGEILWTTRSACIIRDRDGTPCHFLIMMEDITERKRAEEAMREARDDADRANRAKSEFLSRMSHELRTPLNAILGFGQLLERQHPTEQQRSRLHHILSAGRHLLNLINEVLDISRIEAGNLQLSVEPVGVAEVLAEALDLTRPMAADRAMEVSVDAQLGEDIHVLADRQRLKQVLLNLLTNAVKYNSEGGRVVISIAPSGDMRVRVIVTDSGAGIAADKLARLFTPFDRLGLEQSNVEGTGLGLALCQRLMHAMGGEIGVRSNAEKGSAFWIELPAADSPLKALPINAQALLLESATADRARILYIEDNFSNLTLVEQVLAELPHIELLTAMQGGLGLDLARQHLPDLILLDLHLPDVSGQVVLERLRKSERTRHIPVIVISADATAPQIARLLAAGARHYLTKPLDIADFFRVINETLCSRGARLDRAVA